MGEDRLAVAGQHRLGQQAVADQIGAACQHRCPELGCSAAPGQVGEELPDLRWRAVTPAVVAEAFGGDEPGQVVPAAAVLHHRVDTAERPAGQFDLGARMGPAALGPQGQCAAERVQSVERVGAGHDGDRVDRRPRDQIPVDDVAERLVDAHTVDIDRQALGRAEQRRRGKAAVVEVGLEGIALDFIDGDGADLALERPCRRGAAGGAQRLGRQLLEVRRDLVPGHADAGQQGRADDLDRCDRLRLGREC